MKINQEIIKAILTVFQEADTFACDFRDIEKAFDKLDEDKFLFNLQLLNDIFLPFPILQ
jgi:hypothetical protein